MKVVVDAGHGGKDSGAVGLITTEKERNLKAAFILKKCLEDKKMEVVMTRSSDIFVELKRRSSIANESKADLFLSLHCNGFEDKAVKGFEVAHYPTDGKGKQIATKLVQALKEKGVLLRKEPILARTFWVLKKTTMPAVLIEMGFITNLQEEGLLWKDDYLNSMMKTTADIVAEAMGAQEV